jgi:hypothetical protein
MREPMIKLGRFKDRAGNELSWFQRKVGIPGDFPIFKEAPFSVIPDSCFLVLPEHALPLREFLTCARIQSPGFRTEQYWTLFKPGAVLEIQQLDKAPGT